MSYTEYCNKADAYKLEQIEFTEALIKTLHSRNLSISDSAAEYRSTTIEPLETPHRIAAPEDIPHLMNHYISQVTISSYSLHPIEVAAMAYKRFLDIYPFEHHNEETAVAIAGFLLQKAGYYFNGFPAFLKDEYIASIKQAQSTGIPDSLIAVFAKSVELPHSCTL